MLKRIKYVSLFARAMDESEIRKLVKAAAEKNKRIEVTGILMASGNLFFQVIEGPPEIIDQLYAAIARDKRHDHVFLLDEATSRTRLYPLWAMKKLDLDSEAEARLAPMRLLLEALVDQKNQLAKLTESLGRLLWQEVVKVDTDKD